MNIVQMYGQIREIAEQLGRNGGYRCGCLTGEPDHDEFLLQTRLNKAALKRFSRSAQKAWAKFVCESREDLLGHWHRQAYKQRVYSRKQRCKEPISSGLQQRQFEQGAIRAQRIEAIVQVSQRLRSEGKKPTVKAVFIGLARDFPVLPQVQPDTLRKDMRKLKVACQSG